MTETMLPEAAKSFCTEFNQLYPVGSSVLLIRDLGEVTLTEIKWPAEVRYGVAVVGVESEAAVWRLDRIIPIEVEASNQKKIFDDFYDLLNLVANNTGVTLWAMPEGSAVHVTAYDALIDLAEQYGLDGVTKQLTERLEGDSDLREVVTDGL